MKLFKIDFNIGRSKVKLKQVAYVYARTYRLASLRLTRYLEEMYPGVYFHAFEPESITKECGQHELIKITSRK